MTSLFELGPFTLPEGRVTHFKIECDHVTTGSWDALARLAVEVLPPFGRVLGVPRGGVPFADALSKYVTEGPTLIADDVWVTGLSMQRFHKEIEAELFSEPLGIVAFARPTAPLFSWVKALFEAPPEVVEAMYRLDRPHDWWKQDLGG